MKHYYLLWLALLLSFSTYAQKVPADLARRLQGKTRFSDIMQEVETYYKAEGKTKRFEPNEKEEGEEMEGEYLFWKRWEWWMSSHLSEKGTFVDINQLNYKAVQETDKKWKQNITTKGEAPQNRILPEDEYFRSAKVESAYGGWFNYGPLQDGTGPGNYKGLGRIDRIAFHPTNANTIYIGAPAGGVWKTTNGGSSWMPITNSLPSLGVSGLVVSPTNGNVVYVLTGDGDSHSSGYLANDFGSSSSSIGVFKTTDGGTTWTKTGNLYTGAGDFVGHKLAISSTNGNYLIAATNQGLWRTTDGGTTWALTRNGTYWDVEFKPGNDSVVYAAAANSISYSNQGGRSGTWITSTTSHRVDTARRIELAVSPSNASYVYALCGNVGDGNFTGLFRSTNSGVSFTRRLNTPNILGSDKNGSGTGDQSGYDLCIAAKQNDAEYLATGGLTVWRTSSSNGGSSMKYSSVYNEGSGTASEYIHPDVHDVAFSPLNNYLYAATDGGIYRSTDNGVSWTNLSQGVTATQFYRFSMRDANFDGEMDGIGMLGGAQDNGIKFRNNSGTFFHTVCCDGYGSAIAPDDPNTLYMNINDWFGKSTDGGITVNGVLGDITFFSPIAIDWRNADTVYLGGGDTRRSYNGFASVNLTSTQNTRRVLVTCPSNAARLYGSSGSDVVRSDNRVSSWTTVSGTAGWPAGTFTVNDIKPSATNSASVFVTFGGYSAGNKVMRSSNSGDSWTNWSGSLPNVPCYGLAVASEGVYVGTEIGVFFRGYSWTDWVPFYNGMPRVPVTGLWANANGLLYASTFARGMWYSDRRTACLDNIIVSGSHEGPHYYEANTSAVSTLSAPGSTGTEIYIRAGDSIILKTGFEVKTGAFFEAYIAPCSAGGVPNTNRNGTDVVLPDIKEMTENKRPEKEGEYWKISDGLLEFRVTEKKRLQFQAKDESARMITFYPSDTFHPGIYQLRLPNAKITEVQLISAGSSIPKISP